ncbi:type 2 isopentenyl-diphosphate Delta-isomerase [Evansella cellulosilytica]|uniref:Isopentenyl-diphosphate delta-isomerase n=1 Tax=Evansella cellulosilytica (strain ATCC 21833 / DSM 2522 / FERM P-1141 / JCM 9156 / N-4) TaxID=649639 RepID=E6TZE0_EVAC2|nr:type 2 isopentenyl-diphosphate Delta-isomerase [Evansella cellulosilytica]ADU30114.1 isopentenyl-diphosphate delta-isomerase, type 2 [Evansella cellulosilytica DSM 2522]
MNRSQRKIEHLDNALLTGQSRESGFDDIRFIHQSLPDINVDDISIQSLIGELKFSSPIFINAMTGGGGKQTEHINGQLANVANVLNIPIAVGSQMSAIKDATEENTYKIVRKNYQNGIVFANLGSEATLEQAKIAVNMIEANAIQIHLNVIQELVMPEGDRHFRNALNRIESICNNIHVPVIVKEVGFGMSRETIDKLYNVGVSVVDVGGFGGTNFSQIENARRLHKYDIFNDWGIPTAASIVEAKQARPSVMVLATGGIQTSLDIAKSLALGASAVGMAGQVLKWITEFDEEYTIKNLNLMLDELRLIMTAVGATNINMLQQVPILFRGEMRNWLMERRIDTTKFANRSIVSL